jgi:NAD(P)-dependent dehydrogenase (short-subunit alcohol dehydrogenase family)
VTTHSVEAPLPTLPAHLPAAALGTAPGRGLLAGRRLLVVGGGQQTYGQTDPPIGIGRAVSILAAREGAAVAVADVDPAAAQSTADRIHAEGGNAHAVAGDAANPDQAASMVTAAASALGGLDALVLNTGIAAGIGLAGTSGTDWDRVMAVNVRAHFLALQAALPLLPPGSAITLTSSAAAQVVTATEIPAYTTSKAALGGLCAYAAKEYAPRRVRVNVVMAGLIDTSLGRLASQIRPDRDNTPIPLGRQGTAWEIAAATVFLLSDSASYITGVTLPVDGGLTGVQ